MKVNVERVAFLGLVSLCACNQALARIPLSLLLIGALVGGCASTSETNSLVEGEDGNAEPGQKDANTGPATGEGIDYSFESLDVSSLGMQSENWCEAPPFTPAGFTVLDKSSFAALLADYTVGWMTPLHESFLGVREEDFLNALFEPVSATFSSDCNRVEPGDFEFLPPPDDALLDPANREDLRSELLKFIEGGVEVSNGETLRLLIHECDGCNEPLGAAPFFLNARLTVDGVLVLTIELTEGEPWMQTLYITPDAVVLQAELAPFSGWLQGLTSETRSGEVSLARYGGRLTAVARKDEDGGTSTTFGVSAFSFGADLIEEQPILISTSPDGESVQTQEPREVHPIALAATSPCIGMHVGIAGGQGSVQAAAHLGDLSLTIPGSINCDATECGDKEKNGDWVYSLGGLSMTVEQPEGATAKDLLLSLHTESSSKASVAGSTFAEGGVGVLGEGGELSLDVASSPEGFLVTFEPALNLGGAMTISSFSEKLRAELPTWLEDEIFDLTFGGDPRASVFVPARDLCPEDSFDYVATGEPQVEIREGSLELNAGGEFRSVVAGQCIEGSREEEAAIVRTSDWVSLGVVCE